MRAYSKKRAPVQTSIGAQCDNINVGRMMEKYKLGVIDDELMTSIVRWSCDPESMFMWYSFLVAARNRNMYKRDWNIFQTFYNQRNFIFYDTSFNKKKFLWQNVPFVSTDIVPNQFPKVLDWNPIFLFSLLLFLHS